MTVIQADDIDFTSETEREASAALLSKLQDLYIRQIDKLELEMTKASNEITRLEGELRKTWVLCQQLHEYGINRVSSEISPDTENKLIAYFSQRMNELDPDQDKKDVGSS